MKFQTFNKKRQLTLKYKCGEAAGPTLSPYFTPEFCRAQSHESKATVKTLDPRTLPGTSVAALGDPCWRCSPSVGQWSPDVNHLRNPEPSNAGAQIVERRLREASEEPREIKMETYAELRRPQLSGAILRGPAAPFLQPGDRGASGKSLHRAAAGRTLQTLVVMHEWRMDPLGTEPLARRPRGLRAAQWLQ